MLEVEGKRFVVFVDLKVVLAIEEVFVGNEDVKDDASREDITNHIDPLASLHGNDFRSDISWRSAPVKDVRLFLTDGCESEIHKHSLKRVFGPEHNVLQFHIPVHYSEPMHVSQPFGDASHDLLDLLHFEALALIDAIY